LNVMRGCLAQLTEIDRNWNQYINALEDLVGVMKSPFNAEEVFNEFPEKISEAIMHAQEHGKDLDGRVRRACGQPKRVKPPVRADDQDKNAAGKSEKHRNRHRERRNVVVSPAPSSTKQETETSEDDRHPENLAGRLHSFLQAITPSKGFFFNLGDTTCKDKKFSGHAHQGQHCWNGIEIGAYNRTIVGVGLERQENNPEMKVQKEDGANSKVVASILEKLLRIKQHVTGSAVTRDITKSSKRTRSGKHDAFNARGVRNAQYGNYGWPNNMDTGSGYYDDAGRGNARYDEHYDDEDLYTGSGESGSGYEEYGSGSQDTYSHYPAHNAGTSRQKNTYHEAGSHQPKATKNPAQTSHTYNVYPVRTDDGSGQTLQGNFKLVFSAIVIVKLLSGILPY